MSVFEKAKALGKEIRKTEEYKELERTSENVQGDPDANQMINEVQELQQKIQFAQQSGVQPEQEQIDQFENLKSKMNSSLTIQAYAKAQNDFNQLMQDVNKAISDGIKPEGEDGKEKEQ